GQTKDAVDYAQLGAADASTVTGTAAVWLASQQARAHAVLGNIDAAQAAIDGADDARDRLVPDDLDGFGGIMTFPRPRQLYYAALGEGSDTHSPGARELREEIEQFSQTTLAALPR